VHCRLLLHRATGHKLAAQLRQETRCRSSRRQAPKCSSNRQAVRVPASTRLTLDAKGALLLSGQVVIETIPSSGHGVPDGACGRPLFKVPDGRRSKRGDAQLPRIERHTHLCDIIVLLFCHATTESINLGPAEGRSIHKNVARRPVWQQCSAGAVDW
jgi:hypothetical protein